MRSMVVNGNKGSIALKVLTNILPSLVVLHAAYYVAEDEHITTSWTDPTNGFIHKTIVLYHNSYTYFWYI